MRTSLLIPFESLLFRFRAHALAVIAVDFGPNAHRDKATGSMATFFFGDPKANLENFTNFRTRRKHTPCDFFRSRDSRL